jgi:hypothetical protein
MLNNLVAMPFVSAAHELLQKPLIVGASVSSGFGTEGPGDRLAKRFTAPENIVNVAVPGATGRSHTEGLTPDLVKDRSVILAMDFLFWDSVYPDTRPSVQALDRLIRLAGARKIPLVVGDIPSLLGARQVSRATLNKEIRDRCTARKSCYVLKLDDLHRKVMQDRYLEVNGRRYSFRELVPDGLHLADVAGEFLADQIYQLPVFR